jgi:hypothetical protein
VKLAPVCLQPLASSIGERYTTVLTIIPPSIKWKTSFNYHKQALMARNKNRACLANSCPGYKEILFAIGDSTRDQGIKKDQYMKIGSKPSGD